jgi:hypothetical protein
MAEMTAQHYADRIKQPHLKDGHPEDLLVELAQMVAEGDYGLIQLSSDYSKALRWVLTELEARRSEELGRPR